MTSKEEATREEIKNLRELIDLTLDKAILADSRTKEAYKRLKEMCDLAIKELEKESCSDAISRKYLLDDCVVDKVTMPYVPVSKIENAPPVDLQPKTGHWIDADGDNAICGCCNRLNHLYGTYCKHCGAKMVELKVEAGKEMTREEAIEILNFIIEEGWLISDLDKCKAIDACEVAIKALEKDSCEDVINRKIVTAFISGLISDDKERERALKFLNDLPSINSQPKKEHCKDVS